MVVVVKNMIPSVDLVPVIFKALEECKQISQKTKSRLRILWATLGKILTRVWKKVATFLFSFDVHEAMAYLPEIDAALAELTKVVCKIEKKLETSGVDMDDVIDDLEMAHVMANEIFQKLNNAVDKAQSENTWHGVSLSLLSAAVACLSTLLGITAPAVIGLVVGAGLTIGVPHYFHDRTRIQAEENNRIITLNAEINKMKIAAQKLLRTELEGKIKDTRMVAMLEKLEVMKEKKNKVN